VDSATGGKGGLYFTNTQRTGRRVLGETRPMFRNYGSKRAEKKKGQVELQGVDRKALPKPGNVRDVGEFERPAGSKACRCSTRRHHKGNWRQGGDLFAKRGEKGKLLEVRIAARDCMVQRGSYYRSHQNDHRKRWSLKQKRNVRKTTVNVSRGREYTHCS